MLNGSNLLTQGMSWLYVKVQTAPLIAAGSIGDFVFFRAIMDFLDKRIDKFESDLLSRFTLWMSGIAMIVLTVWIMFQGFRMVTGQSRDSMAALVVRMLRSALIVSIAAGIAMNGTSIRQVIDGMKSEISYAVTGEDETPEEQIDESLKWMQVALTSIDVIDVVGDSTLDSQKTRAMFLTTLGTGGPAVTAGAMLMLYKIAMAMFIGFGPLFILCLLFEQTKSLFQRWLMYGIGTMFSLAVLAFMTSVALKMVSTVAKVYWGAALITAFTPIDLSTGISSQALQQGGMGLILTTLIISAPPMAAMFFQGTLGNYSWGNAFGGGGGAGANGKAPGQPGYIPEAPNRGQGGQRGGGAEYNGMAIPAQTSMARQSGSSPGSYPTGARANAEIERGDRT